MSRATRRGRQLAVRKLIAARSGSRADRPQVVTTPEEGAQNLWNADTSIRLLVVLQDHHNRPGHGAERPVQRGDGSQAARKPGPNVEPSRLEFGAVRR